MLRMIIWTATVWFVLVIFSGCANRKGSNFEMTQGGPDQRWVKAKSADILDAPRAKAPKINAATYYAAALLMENQGDLNGAVEKYQKAIEIDNTNLQTYNRLAMVYLKLRKYDIAAGMLKDAIEIKPEAAYLHNNLGFAYLLQHHYRDAEAELRNALALDPNFQRAHINLGLAVAKQGLYQKALSHFLVGCSAAQAHYNLALVLHSEGKLDLAEKYYRLALQYDPNFPLASRGLEKINQTKQPALAKITQAASK